MRFYSSILVALSAFAAAASAKDIVVMVGHNTTGNASAVFQPDQIQAQLGDTVVFNFTLGNHTATQSTFASPCIPAHDTNSTINGFDSGFRDTVNGTAITILSVPIIPENANTTMWFFDFNSCGAGGVGVINPNTSSTETLAGFQRNAARLNGTNAGNSSSSAASSSHRATGSSAPNPSQSAHSSGASVQRQIVAASIAVMPLMLVTLVL